MARRYSESDVYDLPNSVPTNFVVGKDDDIYDSVESRGTLDESSLDESSLDESSLDESEITFDPDRKNTMGPPPPVPIREMKLRKKIKELMDEIERLFEKIQYKDQMIDLLKIKNETLKKENESYARLLDELSSVQKQLSRGGNNKRLKNVSKHSTTQKRNASRRHSTQRKKSGTLRRMLRK